MRYACESIGSVIPSDPKIEAAYVRPLVILSGGQDSMTCLGLALQHQTRFKRTLPDGVHAISFRYNQRHIIELDYAAKACKHFKVPHKIVDISGLAEVATSALTGSLPDVSKPHSLDTALPASFVPGRNALFLTLAHAYALTIKATSIITGVCQTDYSGYPDCRAEFIDRMEEVLAKGYGKVPILTPCMYLTKAQTWELAAQCLFVDTIIHDTMTCYNGVTDLKPWGRGCGTCPSCLLRAKGWREWQDTM